MTRNQPKISWAFFVLALRVTKSDLFTQSGWNGMGKSRIFLVGFMGAGKSTVGPLLARILEWDFLDLDLQIEREQGRTIREIFETEGEPAFRNLETEALNRLAARSRLVVAVGGGAFMQATNREIIARLGTSVFLDCPLPVILARCPADGSRPLLQSFDRARELYALRLPVYRQSDICVDVSNLSPEQVTHSILEQLKTKTQ